MTRKSGYRLADVRAQSAQELCEVFFLHCPCRLVVALRHDALAEHHLAPRIHPEKLPVCLIGVRVILEERNSLRERVGLVLLPEALPHLAQVQRPRRTYPDFHSCSSSIPRYVAASNCLRRCCPH